jgi:hypothetical protein
MAINTGKYLYFMISINPKIVKKVPKIKKIYTLSDQENQTGLYVSGRISLVFSGFGS